MTKSPLIHKKSNEKYLASFLIALGIATAIFLPYIIMDRGIFYFYGDFNAQQVPFYIMAHDAVRSGNIFWNWYTDLGANFIGSYSFYLAGSPFFAFSLLFPSSVVPYLIGPLLILKFALSSLTAYCLFRRFVRKPQSALIGALLYAFSAFSVYNIFFNHFHEAIVFFPLLLLGLEQLMVDNRKGIFALTVALCAISNYFFFVSMVVFLIPYFFVRLFSPEWKLTVGKFINLIFEALLGVGVACFILIPSFFAVIQNNRVSDLLTGWDALAYKNNQLYPNILQCFFFPSDLPARPLFFPDAGAEWASQAGWLPVFSMAGVIAFLQAKRGHWLKRMITVLIIMAFIPLLNSSFIMFNSIYYARWFFMPVLLMSLATAISIESSEDVNWWSAFRWTAGITLAFTLAVGLLPNVKNSSGKISRFGLFSLGDPNFPDEKIYFIARYWVTCGLALGSLVVLALLIPMLRKSTRTFYRISIVSIACVSIITGAFYVGCGKGYDSSAAKTYTPYFINGVKNLKLPADRNYRIDSYDDFDNLGMFFKVPSIQAFHSIVPKSVMDFYPYIGVDRGVASRPEVKDYGIRTLLSVKYLLDYSGDEKNFSGTDGVYKMPGFKYIDQRNNFYIYENQNFVPIGFTYDYSISAKTAEQYGKEHIELMMLKGLMLSDKDITKYRDILPEKIFTETPAFDNADLENDAKALNVNTVKDFKRDNTGFGGNITLDKPNLVFFSVPNDSGWKAYVDNKKAEIVVANKGFMAIKVPAGSHTIRFNYMTPGLIMGVYITLGALLILLVYILIWYFYKRDHRDSPNPKLGSPAFSANPQLDIKNDVQAELYLSEIGDQTVGSFLDNSVQDTLAQNKINEIFKDISEDKSESEENPPE